MLSFLERFALLTSCVAFVEILFGSSSGGVDEVVVLVEGVALAEAVFTIIRTGAVVALIFLTIFFSVFFVELSFCSSTLEIVDSSLLSCSSVAEIFFGLASGSVEAKQTYRPPSSTEMLVNTNTRPV